MNLVFTRIFAVCLLLAGHVPLLALAQAAQCEMACCRKAENASCHRAHTHSGPGLQSVPCASACGNVQLGSAPVGTPGPVLAALPAPGFESRATAASVESPAPRLVVFWLLQRPPPEYLL